MRNKITTGCLIAGLGFGSLLLSGANLSADDAEIVADQIVELREAMGGSSSEDAAAFKEALQQVAANAVATDAPDTTETCAKGCDLCPGKCDKCPVEGCASCSAAEGEEPLSCCTGKLPSRVSVNAEYEGNSIYPPRTRVESNPYNAQQGATAWGANQEYSQTQNPQPQIPNQARAVSGWYAPPSSQQFQPNLTRSLYDSAFSLEQIAHRLEMQNMLDEADVVRKAAVELRHSARKQSRN